MAIDDFEPEGPTEPIPPKQRISLFPEAGPFLDPDDGWLYDLVSKLDAARNAIKVARMEATQSRQKSDAAAHYAEQRGFERGVQTGRDELTSFTPHFRQYARIQGIVAELLSDTPGPEQGLVRRIAVILDMELPEQWRESQN